MSGVDAAGIPARGTALALLSSVTFGASGVLAKPVMEAGVTPTQVTSARIGIAAAVLLVVVALLRPRALRFARGDWGLLVGYGLFGVIGAPLLFFISAARIPVGIAMLLEFTAPILVALWVRFVRGTRLPRAVWWGIAVALLGLAMVGEVWQSVRLDTVGVLAGLGSAVCTAAYYLLGERAAGKHDPLGVLAVGMVVGAVVLAVVSPPWLVPMGTPTDLGPTWALLLGLALVATVVAYLAGIVSLKHLPSSAASVIGLLEPVVATVLAWWLLNEALSGLQVAGAAVLLAGAAAVQVASGRKAPVTPEPVPRP
ncbi:EamA family transporter [Saccharothrix hoggarensis]|uniref:DMT family transporter n=1 Tax=Saccharothrix hoggarensis TaxID=913853 RepID=A0ABW3QVG5_9PSEU